MSSAKPSPPVESFKTLVRMVRRFGPVRVAAAGVFGLLLLRTFMDIAQPRLIAEVVQTLEDHFGTNDGLPSSFAQMMVLLGAVLLVRVVLQYATAVAATAVGQDVENRLRSDLFRQVLRLRFRYHDKNRSGETIARSLRDMEQAKQFYREVWFGYVEIVLLLVAVLTAIFLTHWTYGLVALLIYSFGVTACIHAGRHVARIDRGLCDEYDNVVSVLTENVAGARVVRAFGREQDESAKFGGRMDAMSATWSALERFWTGVMPLVGHLYSLCIPIMLVIGALRMANNGPGSLGEMLAVILYCRAVQHRIRPLTRLVIVGQKAVASASRVFEVLDTRNYVEVVPPADTLPASGGALSFADVEFAHGETDVLRGVTLEVPAGTSLGIIGPTGAGKTSLVQLIPRFYDPSSGSVRIDGVDVRHLDPDALRAAVGLVFQEPFLFSETIARNVAYGRPDATQAEIENACRLASADTFVRDLPEGYETIIGERGVSLSGGQRQRLTIARALLQDPRILVFDDATASVDAVTERTLFDSIRAAAQDRTTVVISQRVPSVRWCDQIAVFDEGRVTAIGSHDALLQSSPLYKEINHHQRLIRSSS